MYCPQCNSSCLETSLRCTHCGASLVLNKAGDSQVVHDHSLETHTRIGSTVGGVLGAALFIALHHTVLAYLYLDRGQVSMGVAASAGVGALIGRRLVRRHFRNN